MEDKTARHIQAAGILVTLARFQELALTFEDDLAQKLADVGYGHEVEQIVNYARSMESAIAGVENRIKRENTFHGLLIMEDDTTPVYLRCEDEDDVVAKARNERAGDPERNNGLYSVTTAPGEEPRVREFSAGTFTEDDED